MFTRCCHALCVSHCNHKEMGDLGPLVPGLAGARCPSGLLVPGPAGARCPVPDLPTCYHACLIRWRSIAILLERNKQCWPCSCCGATNSSSRVRWPPALPVPAAPLGPLVPSCAGARCPLRVPELCRPELHDCASCPLGPCQTGVRLLLLHCLRVWPVVPHMAGMCLVVSAARCCGLLSPEQMLPISRFALSGLKKKKKKKK